jgi:hypothetical protein
MSNHAPGTSYPVHVDNPFAGSRYTVIRKLDYGHLVTA